MKGNEEGERMKDIWETPRLDVLGDLAILTAAGGTFTPDAQDLSTTGPAPSVA